MSSNRGVTPSLSELVVAIVRGDLVPSDVLERTDPGALSEHARSRGVLPMVADRLAARGNTPAALSAHLRQAASRHAAIDLVREVELRTVVAELADASVDALLMKGAHLAYTHYGRPDLRPRLDTDILIADSARTAVGRVLTRLGYEQDGQVSGDLVMSQACYLKRQRGAVLHVVDVHWRLANPQVFAEVLSYSELAAAAVPVPGLGPAARGLSSVHALLVACVHRIAHHFDADHLIWLYDIQLLASHLDDSEWDAFVTLAVDRGVASVCRQSLRRTADVLHTCVPAGVLATLGARGAERSEASAAYLSLTPRARRHVYVFLSDLKALSSWKARWRLVSEHMFPSARYMRDVYAPSSSAPLSILYMRRAVRGARRWLVRT